MNIYPPTPFFWLPDIILCFCAWGIHTACVLVGGPAKLRHPPGLECEVKEAEKQKQWGHCSGHRAATAHRVLRDLSVGGALLAPVTSASCCTPSSLAWL